MTRHVRALFLSDIHLGTRACQADHLLAFLKEYECDHLFLVGDIIDFWAMSRAVYWPASHNTIVQKVLKKARHNTKVFLIPGNHDELLREHVDSNFGDVHLVREHVHTAADGKKYLLLHGDEYDQITALHRWVSILGDISYTFLIHLNRGLSWLRRKLGVSGHWSLADYAKRNVLQAVSFISDFETAVARTAAQRGLDGVICGHIHTAAMRNIENITYINCGDWVDSCTAVVEHQDGRMELLRWEPPVAAANDEQGKVVRLHTPDAA
ncbi:MAG: UDP-2,3-diacylglucosamine diphosphatase [Burkholderiales bacterium]|jgi:UDP-2,3-diacylglucosamine pyrophosphatase LpxH|nr:UDP-2,3-diacylglucosamine diphosphatase [Burkholderiales bacterium]